MKNWFNIRSLFTKSVIGKVQLVQEQEQETLKLQDIQNKKQAELDADREEMFNSLCAINNRQNCFAECTHFDEGRIVNWIDHHNKTTVYHIRPKCRLWSR